MASDSSLNDEARLIRAKNTTTAISGARALDDSPRSRRGITPDSVQGSNRPTSKSGLLGGRGVAKKTSPNIGQVSSRHTNMGERSSRLIGTSRAIKNLREKVAAFAPESDTVSIVGESGVGKELVARELHSLSGRAGHAFVPLNMCAIPEQLATAELFGHEKGAYTGAHIAREGAFAAADGGSLYLDEIGDMPLGVQTQLLRVLDDGVVTKIGARTGARVNARLISATNANLAERIETGDFRQDLFYRLNVLPIHVPPLRERGEDVLEIAQHFISNHEREHYRLARLTPNAADRLCRYNFPGNVRELKNIISRAVIFAHGKEIFPEHLCIDDEGEGSATAMNLDANAGKDLFSQYITVRALIKTDGNITKAASLIGSNRVSLHKTINQLDTKDYRAQEILLRKKLSSYLGFVA